MAGPGAKRRELPIPSADQVRAMGLSDAEWALMNESLGRPPNELETTIFAVAWNETYQQKSVRSITAALGGEAAEQARWKGARVSTTNIGNGYSLALGISDTNAETTRDPKFGAELAVSTAYDKISSIGANPLAILSSLRLGDAESTANNKRSRAAIDGLSLAANSLGLPLLGGDVFFNKAFDVDLLCNVGALGIAKTDSLFKAKSLPVRSPVVYIGQDTAHEGIRRPLVSEMLAPDSPASEAEDAGRRFANVFYQKQTTEAVLAAVREGLISAFVILDDGGLATGLLQLAHQLDSGLQVALEKMPCVDEEFRYLERVLSLTPHRIVAATDKDKHRALTDFLAAWNLRPTTIGEVVDSVDVELFWHHHEVGVVPYRFVSENLVAKDYNLIPSAPMLRREDDESQVRSYSFEMPQHLEDTWVDLLANVNLCSRELSLSAFDIRGGGNTVLSPFGGGALQRLVDPEDGAGRGLACAIAGFSRYVAIDPYVGAVQSIASAYRKVAATGAKPKALCISISLGSPESFREISRLSEIVRAVKDASNQWGLAILDSSISCENGSDVHPILTTPVALVVGIHENVNCAVPTPFQGSGDSVFLLGSTADEIGGSEYASFSRAEADGDIPEIDFDEEAKLASFLEQLALEGVLRSACEVSSGGLGRALSEACVGGSELQGVKLAFREGVAKALPREDVFLFSESGGRFLVSCSKEQKARFLEFASAQGVEITAEGTVGGKHIALSGGVDYSIALKTAQRIWKSGLSHVFNSNE